MKIKHNLQAKAETQLLTALDQTRSLSVGRKSTKKLSTNVSPGKTGHSTGTVLPPAPSRSEEDEEKMRVTVLGEPVITERDFEGLQRLKVSKKERHIETVEAFTNMLNKLSDTIEQDLLTTSRDVRDKLEDADDERNKFYENLKNPDFLIPKQEDGLVQLLEDIKGRTEARGELVEQFAGQLDDLEKNRADTVSRELRTMMDKLIAIAHQLPDEIEHLIETEVFELNKVLTANRKSHVDLLQIMRKRQVECEVEGLQLWENARRYWRQLRHDKALSDFDHHINSAEFVDPDDRQSCLKSVRQGQSVRKGERQRIMRKFGEFDALNINSDSIKGLQAEFNTVSEEEIGAIQSCYDQLNLLHGKLEEKAKARVESLRKELHRYGALHPEPDLKERSATFNQALHDQNMSELWRLGGGLKPEFTQLANDFVMEEIVYDYHVSSMQTRLEFLTTGFPIKGIMEERGQLSKLEKTRNTIVKLRTVPRSEIPDVLGALIPDLEEMREIENVPELTVSTINTCLNEMSAELDRVAEVAAEMAVADNDDDDIPLGGTMGGSATARSTAPPPSQAGAESAAGRTRQGSTMGATRSSATEVDRTSVDPMQVKMWNRKLGILYFCSELPEEYQTSAIQALADTKQQRECNVKVDAVVSDAADEILATLDRRYKKLIDSIATFLENQAGRMATAASNIGDFYLGLAKIVEAHRAEQIRLDEQTEDELWDWKEDFRMELEDRENGFEAACDKIRQSITYDELAECFQQVLVILTEIEDSYRAYHGKACYLSDRYPLTLSEEFKLYLLKLCKNFCMEPVTPHPVLHTFDFLTSEMFRLNRKYVTDGDAHEEEEKDENEELEAEVEAEPTDAAGEECDESKTKTEIEESPYADEWLSPSLSPEQADGTGAPSEYAGKYGLSETLLNFAYTFYQEKEEVEEVPAADANANKAVEGEGSGEDAGNDEAEGERDGPDEEGEPQEEQMNPDIPWLLASIDLLDSDKVEKLDADDKLAYETSLVAAFRPFPEEQIELTEALISQKEAYAAAVAEAEANGEEAPEPEAEAEPEEGAVVPLPWTREKLTEYQQELNVMIALQQRLDTENDPEYIRTTPPADPSGKSWVSLVEILPEEITGLLGGIRTSVITELESEAYNRVDSAKRVNKAKKGDFTDELEDRLRTHWPRRGRVETQIKQPREAELLGHEEKTWRHIQSIQDKAIALKTQIDDNRLAATNACDNYVSNIVNLRTSLTTKGFRTLAALQGVDQRARNTLLEFQAAAATAIKHLTRMVEAEASAIITYAYDQFRKTCPPQEKGKEGGYSPQELEEIEGLVRGQCDEIEQLQEQWRKDMEELTELQQQSQKTQDTFQETYENAVQELSLSEGLGQKYGAPRRRAQERLRTEVTRDEQAAGRIDELLAMVEFTCQEQRRLAAERKAEALADDDKDEIQRGDDEAGRAEYLAAMDSWRLFKLIRIYIKKRCEYLQIVDKPLNEVDLSWLDVTCERLHAISKDPNEDPDADMGEEREHPIDAEATRALTATSKIFAEIVAEVDESCRTETKELYISEGREDALGGDIPESLQKWLEQSQHKLLGPGGHREKAWKRIWGQVARMELLLSRRIEEDHDEAAAHEKAKIATAHSGPATVLMMLSDSFLLAADAEMKTQEYNFKRVLLVLEKGREKHERLLRPRLGSPDAAEELQQLDTIEVERHEETVQSVQNFRSALVQRLIERSKDFAGDISLSYKGLLQVIDTTLYQEVLQVPPDTAVPKKRMTLKRLRKAQRVRSAVASGEEDWTVARTWASMEVESMVTMVQAFENMILEMPKQEAEAVEEDPKGKKGKKKEPEPEPETTEKATMLPQSWIDAIKTESSVYASVSTAHRALVAGRDEAFDRFVSGIRELMGILRQRYDVVLQQEKSWMERWRRQVEMLRSGNL